VQGGVNLKTGRSSLEALSGAVDEVLKEPKYRLRAKELMGEVGGFDPIKVLVESNGEVLKEKGFKN
jgi:UDP:flavonoid glycosyltransferase YjiC (YdhE family)